jgi:hypothetical protein
LSRFLSPARHLRLGKGGIATPAGAALVMTVYRPHEGFMHQAAPACPDIPLNVSKHVAILQARLSPLTLD